MLQVFLKVVPFVVQQRGRERGLELFALETRQVRAHALGRLEPF